MPLQGTFQADFNSFFAAVQQAEVSLKSFEQGANKVEGSLNRMTDSFSGRRIISEATLMSEAIERSGGISNLTARELERAGQKAAEAADKMRRLGIDVPPGLQRIADAAKPIAPELTLADKAAGLLKSTFGQFTLAGLATRAISALSVGVMEFIDTGSRLPSVEASFVRLNAAAQQNSNEMLASMTAGTKGMVSNYDLMLSANKAMLLGLPVTTTAMGELSRTATTLGRAMGKDATSSLNDLITALGRSSPLILDNLGLTVKVGEANEAYAAKLGKTEAQLTDAEKKTAFYEAAMEAARKKTVELGDQTKTLGEIATTVWTSIGNAVSSTAATLNVGLGAAVSSGRGFVQFLEDSLKMGFSVATQMAAVRAQSEQLAASNAKVGESAPVDRLGDYRKELEGLRTASSGLTVEQQALIKQALDLNQSTTDIATKMGISTTAVSVYADHLKTAKADAEKLAAAQAELQSSGDGWKGTLAGINAEVVKAVRGYLEAGVAQASLATVYGLTATQVKAVATALAEEEKAAKKATEGRARGLEELTKLEGLYAETVASNAFSTVAIELAKNDRILDAAVARLQRLGIAETEYSDLVKSLSAEMTTAVLVDVEALRSHSRTALEEKARIAEATYQAALAASGEFSAGAIEHFRLLADEARRASLAWGTSFDQAGDRIVDKAKAVLDQVRIYTEQMVAAVMPLQQLTALDVQKMGGEGALRKRQQEIEAYYAKYPGARSGGSGQTGIASGDEGGYRRLLEMQVLYAQIQQYFAGGGRAVGGNSPVSVLPLTGGVGQGGTILPYGFSPTSGMNVTVNVSGHVIGTQHELARLVSDAMGAEMRSRGVRWGSG